jgi:hypothetical protein
MPDFLIFGAIYAASGLLHGVVGFAFAVLAVPLLSMIYSPQVAVGMTIIVGPCLMFYNAWLHRQELDFRALVPLVAVGALFIPVGALFLSRTPEAVTMIVLGTVVIALTLFTLVSGERTTRALAAPGVGYGFSALSGFIAGAFTAGGPPIAAYLYNTDTDRKRAKANVQLFFAVLAIAALISHIVAGTVTGPRTVAALPYIPVAFLSIRLGALIAAKIPLHAFRMVTDIALVALGLYLIVSHI